ncbi:sigma 54-interacting transcriptional regulator [Cellulosilyticum sp. I15G10I2]|uniref:sigma 54-interacting transcriptional regulator n=1 Tax=Cellulosilyticum sp. I15G10I2 TaxID=1892843 RepID=UPI00085BBC75|nr:sigma 54-interacting transcriptional regulator [Cellulosilyticum sp. I15G10I2]
MVEPLLRRIQKEVMNYADVISKVLQVDVDITDNKLYRLAGTGRFADTVGTYIENEATGFKWVLENRCNLIIEEPKKHSICKMCPSKDVCKEVFEIGCPIMLGEEVIGVIALACFEKEQKKVVFDNLAYYIDFLENIAELIASKVGEYTYYEEHIITSHMLKKVMEFVDKGVLIFGRGHTIRYMNQYAENILGNNQKQLEYLYKINQFKCMPIEEKNRDLETQYIFRVGQKQIHVQGRIFKMTTEMQSHMEVFIFQDIIDIKKRYVNVLKEDCSFDRILGSDETFLSVKEQAKRLAQTDKNILIYGESGVGKESFARAIHHDSRHKDKPFVTVNCTGIVEADAEEIFGDSPLSKMSLTGSGTLFFDEAADLPLRIQIRLLESLQLPGGFKGRIIISTNKDLEELVKQNQFRKDLYYLLHPFSLSIPPLRCRTKDIKELIQYFLKKYSYMEGKKVTIQKEALYELQNYPWKGNIRELENSMSYMILLNQNGTISHEDVLEKLNKSPQKTSEEFNLQNLEKQTIIKVMNRYANTVQGKKAAAKILGISMATLYRKIEYYNILAEKAYKISQDEKSISI